MRFLFSVLILGAVVLSTGCGYTLQTSRNAILDEAGIRKVYVKPLVNNTFKPGAENVVYNALVQALLSNRRVVLVQDEDEADAVLQGAVNQAQYGISAPTGARNIMPKNFPVALVPEYTVASVYTAVLTCSFSLQKTKHAAKQQVPFSWNQAFSRAKPFPASNQLDVPGTTSSLINESEFDRALSEIAVAMMADVHESMLSMF